VPICPRQKISLNKRPTSL